MTFFTFCYRSLFFALALLLGSTAAFATIAIGEVIPPSEGNCDGRIQVLANGTAGSFFIEIIGPAGFSDFVEGIGDPGDENSPSSHTFTGLCGGDYIIYVTNKFGCATTLTTNLACSLSISAEIIPSCTPGGGAINITPENGTAPYLYKWRNTNGTFASLEQSINNVAPDEYIFDIVDANGCKAHETFSTIPDEEYPYIKEVEVYALIDGIETLVYKAEWQMTSDDCIRYNGGTLTINQQIFDAIAIGDAELKIVVKANKPLLSLLLETPQSPGSLPDLKWFESNGEVWNIQYSSEVAQSMITEGSIYFPLVFNGYDDENRFLLDLMTLSNGLAQCVTLPTLNENCQWMPQPLPRKDDVHIIGSSCISFDFDVEVENISYNCQTGLADVCVKVINGGTSDYTYIWENTQIGTCANNLTPGGCYNVIVTNICGESKTECIEIPSMIPLAIESHQITPNCSSNEGEIELVITGGREPYSLNWTGPEGFSVITAESKISNLIQGNYFVTVTDQCSHQVTMNFLINEINDNTNIIISENIPVCTDDGFGSLVDISIEGATASQYQWSNGSVAEDLQNAPSGDYTVTVTDVNGCKSTKSITILPSNHYPFKSYWVGVHEYPCTEEETGKIFASLSSYPPDSPFLPYTFTWSNGAVHTASTIFDESVVDDIPIGGYSVTITDSRGCERIENVALQPSSFDIEFQVISCDPQLKALSTSNENNVPRFIKWDDGETIAWTSENNANILDNPTIGTHCVTVTDWRGCQEEACYYFNNPMMEIILDDIRHPTYYPDEDIEVNDGFIKISVLGGTPPYTYLWNNAETTEDIFDLSSSYYEVTVTDVNGCSSIQSFNIVTCPSITYDFKVEIGPRDVTPCTTGNGSIRPQISGGTLPYTFSWTGPNGFTANTQNISNLTIEGNYCFTVTDYCGNTITNCQYMTCDCPTIDFSYGIQDRCLEIWDQFPWPGYRSYVHFQDIASCFPSHDIRCRYGNNIYNNTIPDDGGFKFEIEWSNGKTGLYTYDYYQDEANFSGTNKVYVPSFFNPGGLITSTVTDFLGCQHSEFHYFSKKEKGGILIAEPLNNYIPADDGFDAYTKSQGCDICGGKCVNTPGTPEFLQYDPTSIENPCKGGGKIFSHRGIFTVPENTQAIEYVDYSRGVSLGNGECQYPCGCLFPLGTIEGVDKAVYIVNTVKIEAGNCTDPPIIDTGCEGQIEFKYVGECKYKKFCNATGEFIDDTLYPGGGTYCLRRNADGSCKVITECNLEGCIQEVVIDNINCEEAINLFPALRTNCTSCFSSPEEELFFINNLFDTDSLPSVDIEILQSIYKPFVSEGWSKAQLVTKVYPNPFKELFYLEIENQESEILQIDLFSTTGKHILNKNSYVVKGKSVVFIEVNKNLPSGVYYLKVDDKDGNIYTHKIVH